MKAQDLRIGNAVMFLGEEVIVECIENLEGRTEIYWIKPKGMIPSKIIHFKGVTITEEALLRFGFKYAPCGISGADMWQGLGFWSKDDIILRGDKKCKYPLKLQGYINSSYEYIHELQNLFFELTKKELI